MHPARQAMPRERQPDSAWRAQGAKWQWHGCNVSFACFLFPVSMLDCMLSQSPRDWLEMHSSPVIRPARVKRQGRNPYRPAYDECAEPVTDVHADIFHDAVSCFV
jgi:hypothetical protein